MWWYLTSSRSDTRVDPRAFRRLVSGLLSALFVLGLVESFWSMFSGSAQVAPPPVFTKSFVDNPAPLGRPVILEFTINNESAQSATAIAFTDDLDAMLPGLSVAAAGLPAGNACGPGSALSGTTLLDLTGGSLPPSSSCTFDVRLEIPGSAEPGRYTNTTSLLTSSLGSGVPATDTLSASPLNFYPFTHPRGDLLNAEVSGLEVYNVNFLGGAEVGIMGGPDLDLDLAGLDTNDVFAITGNGPDSFAVVVPQRTGFLSTSTPTSIAATIGLLLEGGEPRIEGLVSGRTYGSVSTDKVVDDGGDPAFTGCGAVPFFEPTRNGMLAFSFNETGNLGSVFYSGAHAVDCSVELELVETESGRTLRTRVWSRPAGTVEPFDSLFDQLETTAEQLFQDGVTTGFGAFRLADGGTMSFDDVRTSNFNGPAEQAVLDLADPALAAQVDALIEIASEPNAARNHLDQAINYTTLAENAIGLGEFLTSTRSPQALSKFTATKALSRDAISAIARGDETQARNSLIGAIEAQAEAGLYMRGHDPQPAPLTDGVGGFDFDDILLVLGTSRFESGDVSAWTH